MFWLPNFFHSLIGLFNDRRFSPALRVFCHVIHCLFSWLMFCCVYVKCILFVSVSWTWSNCLQLLRIADDMRFSLCYVNIIRTMWFYVSECVVTACFFLYIPSFFFTLFRKRSLFTLLFSFVIDCGVRYDFLGQFVVSKSRVFTVWFSSLLTFSFSGKVLHMSATHDHDPRWNVG